MDQDIPTRTVRTTMQPDVDIQVDDTEYAELVATGLLLESDVPDVAAQDFAKHPTDTDTDDGEVL